MSAGRKKILWVDGEIEFFRSQITFLETRGYSVIPVFNSVDLLSILHQNEKIGDLILIDDKVNGNDSSSIISEIRKINPNLPIVLISQGESERPKKGVTGAKSDAIITRPVTTSQILSICKKLVNPSRAASQRVKESFVRSYSEIKTTLSSNVSLKDFYRIYEILVNWDLEIENTGDEGLRQTLSGLKSDTAIAFSNFIVHSYGLWINKPENAPLLGHKVIEKQVRPLLTKDKKSILVVISGMRFDQYIYIEKALNELYKVNRQFFLSTLPSSEEFSRNAFFAGELPFHIAAKYPDLLSEPVDSSKTNPNRREDILLYKNFSENGTLISDSEPYYSIIHSTDDAANILNKIQACHSSQLITLTLDIDEHVSHFGFNAQEINDFRSDENSRRLLTDIWFQKSELLKVLNLLASQNVNLILTSDHGSVLCSRATEIYNTQNILKNRRYKFGRDISADERRIVFISDPLHFGLPSFGEQTNFLIAKENFYFSHPEKFEFYQKEYSASFQKGGISPEEMIMPLGIFQAK